MGFFFKNMHHNTKVIDFLFNNSELFVNPSIIFDKLDLKWVEMFLFLIQSFLSCLLKKKLVFVLSFI